MFSPSCPPSYATKLCPKQWLRGKKLPSSSFNVASYKRAGIRLSFEYTTTLLLGRGGEGRIGTATMFRKMLPKYAIFSTVLSKIVAKEKIHHHSEAQEAQVILLTIILLQKQTNKPQQAFAGTILKQKQIVNSDSVLEVKSIPSDYIMLLGNPADHHSSDAM